MDSRPLLGVRRAQVAEDDAILGMIFDSALAVAQQELGAGELEQLKKRLGLPRKLVGFLKYPARAYLELADALAEKRLARGQPFQTLMQELGTNAVKAFFDSTVGKTMVAINGGNAHRMLAAAPVAYSTTFSFGQRRYERRGDKRAAMHFSRELLGPAIQLGIVETGLQQTAFVKPRISLENASAEGLAFTLDIAWD